MGVTGFTGPVQLDASMTVEGFSCGRDAVDRWFAARALKAKAQGNAVVYVSHRAGADRAAEPPAGFYTLSSASVERGSIAGGALKRNAPAQVPVVLLGMLGVDVRYQGAGLGRMLLHDAALRALAVSDAIGARALVVDPLDDAAAGFYARNGFAPIPGQDRMFAPLRRRG